MRVSNGLHIAAIIGLAVLLAIASGCGGPATSETDAGSSDIPELTDADINERINDTGVWDVPPESGTGQPISWSFDEDEPKEITVVDKQITGNRAAIVLDIKTSSAPRARNLRYLAGQMRTDWELRTGWALRRWEIVNTENISIKYKDLPKPTPSPTP